LNELKKKYTEREKFEKILIKAIPFFLWLFTFLIMIDLSYSLDDLILWKKTSIYSTLLIVSLFLIGFVERIYEVYENDS